MSKAIFLDRDGTINVEKHYLHRIGDFEFLPGVIEGLKILQDEGFLLIIITNQSGIGRGYYTEEDFLTLNTWMINELKCQGVNIEKTYYCPHLPDAKIEKYRQLCTCRKPALGMYEQAVKEFDIDLSQSFSIGDKIRDCAICEVTDCRAFLIGNNEKVDVIDKVKAGEYIRIKYVETLFDGAMQIVEAETKF